MSRLLSLLTIRRVLVGAGILLASSLFGGLVGGPRLFRYHVQQVTGRTGITGVHCLYCHRSISPPLTRDAAATSGYLSPAGMAVSPDGTRLYVAAADADRLLEIDLAAGKVSRSVVIDGRPHGLAISAQGSRIAVACRDAHQVRIVDTATLRTVQEVATGNEPLGVALSADGRRLFVGIRESQLLLVDLDSPSAARRLTTGPDPYAMALSTDGSLLVVVSRLVRTALQTQVPAAEITFIDTRQGRVVQRRPLSSAHLSEAVALSADGSSVFAPAVRFRNFLPTTQVARGAVMTSALAVTKTDSSAALLQLPTDDVNAFFADPSGIILTPDDAVAFIAHGGADVVTAVDLRALDRVVSTAGPRRREALADHLGVSAEYVLARIPTHKNPRALAISPDGSRLYVAERLADSVAVIDTQSYEVIERIDLGGPSTLNAARRGEQIFHDASGTFQGQFSCRSCHPEGHTDRLTWDFEIDGVGRNRVDTRSLRGIRYTEPFKWNGKNPDLRTQCGPRFSRVLMRSDPFSPEQLDDLVTFIESIPVPRRALAGELAASRERGHDIFFRTTDRAGRPIPKASRCDTCHPPPLYTDRLKADIGSGTFDTAHLIDIGTGAPYLHDGRAGTLEEIWTVHSPDDTHGVTNDLTKVELNDLMIFLRSL